MSTETDSVFIRTFSIVLAALAVLGVMAYIMASLVAGSSVGAEYGVAAVAERVAPVGRANVSGEPVDVNGEPLATASAPAAAPIDAGTAEVSLADVDGEAIYNGNCAACHGAGIAGAPKFADAGAWTDRLAQGVEVLYDHAINGYAGAAGVMPARGGNSKLADAEVMAAVNHMVLAVGGEIPAMEESSAPEQGSEAAPSPETAAGESVPEANETMDKPADAVDTPPASDMAAAMGDDSATASVDDAVMDLVHGKSVYDSACWVCHNPGAAGAPKFGDAAAWAPRIDKGMATLYDHAINGFMGEAGLMPPKGGRTDLSDDDVKAAVAYMVDSSR